MDSETKYAYQKRIKELEREINALNEYRYVCRDIHAALIENLVNGNQTNSAWIIGQFKRVWK